MQRLNTIGRMLSIASFFMIPGYVVAASPVLKLTSDQLQTAKVTFVVARAVNASQSGNAEGATLRLAGRAVVPNVALDVVLAPAAGRVESLLVNPGQQVQAGQPLARLYSAEVLAMQRDLVSARARAALATARAERDEALFAEGIIARNRLLEARAELADAQAVLREHQQLLRLTGLSEIETSRIRVASDITSLLTITARRSGTVLQQGTGPGQQVAAGDPLFQIAALDHLWLELQATRDQARRIAVGDSVQVAGCTDTAKVLSTSLLLDSQSQTVTVRAEMRDAAGCLSPNQFLEAGVSPRAAGPDLVIVPEGGLVRLENRDHVFVRTDGGLRPVIVNVERRASGTAWVSGALQAGDAVAATGLAALKGSWLGLGAAAESGQSN